MIRGRWGPSLDSSSGRTAWSEAGSYRTRPPRGYPFRMSDLTSLKVSSAVRDRFAAAAKFRGLTVRALLDQLSREVADTALMEQAARQMSQLREEEPEAWREYLSEGLHWEEATVEPLDA